MYITSPYPPLCSTSTLMNRPLQAYDSHCNIVLGEVEETIYLVDDDDEDNVRVIRCTTSSPPLPLADTMTRQ